MWIGHYVSASFHTTAELLDELYKKSGTVSLQSDEEYTVYLDGVLQPNDCFEISAIDVKNYSITINNEDKRIDIISAK